MVTVVDVDAGPRTVARRVEVPASASRVFALLANPRRLRELDGAGTMRDVPVIGPERLTVGDTFTVGLEQDGMPYQATCTVTALEVDKFIEWEDAYGRKWRWELAELADGTTEVTESLDTGSAVIPLFDAMFGGEADRNATAITLSLHKLAESFDGPTEVVRTAICYSRWASPNLKAAS
jgi:uncharacterized protein YndB with AHSA1/START domain